MHSQAINEPDQKRAKKMINIMTQAFFGGKKQKERKM